MKNIFLNVHSEPSKLQFVFIYLVVYHHLFTEQRLTLLSVTALQATAAHLFRLPWAASSPLSLLVVRQSKHCPVNVCLYFQECE